MSPHKTTGQFNFRKNEILASQKFYAAFATNYSPCCKGSEQSCACRATSLVLIMDVPLPQRGGMALAGRAIRFGFLGSKPEGTTCRNRREGNAHPGVLGRSQAMTPFCQDFHQCDNKNKNTKYFHNSWSLEILLVEQECDLVLGKLTR